MPSFLAEHRLVNQQSLEYIPGRDHADELFTLTLDHDYRQARVLALVEQFEDLRKAGGRFTECQVFLFFQQFVYAQPSR